MRLRWLLLAAAALGLALPAAAQPPVKVYISADMEGVAGAVTADQLGPRGFVYVRFRGFMTDVVIAALEGARAAGATEFLVSDSHGNGENLLIEKFPKDVQIVRSWPRPLMMMQGIDGSFGAVLFVGYHTSTTNPAGVRAHTMSSANLADVRINGISVPEAGVNAAVARQFGVPVAMVSGDDAIVKEAQSLLGPIESAVVKWAIGFHSARTLTPEASCDRIRESTKRAIGRISEWRPYRVSSPVTLDVRFKNYRPAEVLSYLPTVERTDAHSIRYRGKDILEVVRFLEFILYYEPGLSP
jgi:D-amino peptidase